VTGGYREGMTEPAAHWRQTLRTRLMVARKDRDATLVSALRSALSAIDNAETPDVDVPAAGAIAASVAGLGAAEVSRRVLTGSYQLFDDQTAELAGGSGDDCGHGVAFRWGSVVPT
jgi:uncharacterized protein